MLGPSRLHLPRFDPNADYVVARSLVLGGHALEPGVPFPKTICPVRKTRMLYEQRKLAMVGVDGTPRDAVGRSMKFARAAALVEGRPMPADPRPVTPKGMRPAPEDTPAPLSPAQIGKLREFMGMPRRRPLREVEADFVAAGANLNITRLSIEAQSEQEQARRRASDLGEKSDMAPTGSGTAAGASGYEGDGSDPEPYQPPPTGRPTGKAMRAAPGTKRRKKRRKGKGTRRAKQAPASETPDA